MDIRMVTVISAGSVRRREGSLADRAMRATIVSRTAQIAGTTRVISVMLVPLVSSVVAFVVFGMTIAVRVIVLAAACVVMVITMVMAAVVEVAMRVAAMVMRVIMVVFTMVVIARGFRRRIRVTGVHTATGPNHKPNAAEKCGRPIAKSLHLFGSFVCKNHIQR